MAIDAVGMRGVRRCARVVVEVEAQAAVARTRARKAEAQMRRAISRATEHGGAVAGEVVEGGTAVAAWKRRCCWCWCMGQKREACRGLGWRRAETGREVVSERAGQVRAQAGSSGGLLAGFLALAVRTGPHYADAGAGAKRTGGGGGRGRVGAWDRKSRQDPNRRDGPGAPPDHDDGDDAGDLVPGFLQLLRPRLVTRVLCSRYRSCKRGRGRRPWEAGKPWHERERERACVRAHGGHGHTGTNSSTRAEMLQVLHVFCRRGGAVTAVEPDQRPAHCAGMPASVRVAAAIAIPPPLYRPTSCFVSSTAPARASRCESVASNR